MTPRGQRCSGVPVSLIFGGQGRFHRPQSRVHMACPTHAGVSLSALQQEVDPAQVAFLDTFKWQLVELLGKIFPQL